MWASPAGIAAISAGINAGAQYLQNGTINPVDMAVAAATGGAGAHGGLLWNMGVNAAGGAGGTAINNYLYGKNDSVIGSAISSGTLSSLGDGIGKLSGSAMNSVMRPTINTPNWATSGSWNLFRPNNYPPIGGSVAGASSQEMVTGIQQQMSSRSGGEK
ncbi:hypothetical protein [Herbaspirillum autotrophicum]|uniref:hypothetical protein n=1 Tax=Herbaspirillum autotrophicum TaxID=180195 RepID=UPI0012ECEB0D|nr:hypothetical protein [Herbaspirillum autotrophicum]